MSKTFVCFAFVALVGCRVGLSGEDTVSDLNNQRTQVGVRVLALKSHLAEQEKVETTQLGRGSLPRMHPPPDIGVQSSQATQPEGVSAYREHIAMLSEKQLLVDMQVALSAMNAAPNVGNTKNRLAEIDAQLATIEEAQRRRDRDLRVESPGERH